jgi:hypothetical protein
MNPYKSPPTLSILQMGLFWTHLVLTLTIISSSLILLSATTTPTTPDPSPSDLANRLLDEVTDWIDHSQSIEKQNKSDPCNAPPSLSYLRSAVKFILMDPFEDVTQDRSRMPPSIAVELLLDDPLWYSFYMQNVLPPYRSHISEANASTTSFCYLDHRLCERHEYYCKQEPSLWYRDAAVCFPNSDATNEGTCVSCTDLQAEIEKGTLKDADSIGYLMDTCEPSTRRGPKQAPWRGRDQFEKNTTNEVRWLRWFLESSYVFERKKVGDDCTASQALNKARAYLNVTMKKHFGKLNVSGSLSLTVPGKETKEEEAAYERVRADLFGESWYWWEKKLFKHMNVKSYGFEFEEVYCSREEGLVCVDGICKDCGDEEVGKTEACHPDKEGVLRKEDEEGEEGSSSTSTEGRSSATGKENSAGGGQDGQRSSEVSVILGILCSSIVGSFRWKLNS